jgi:hypothetical protein
MAQLGRLEIVVADAALGLRQLVCHHQGSLRDRGVAIDPQYRQGMFTATVEDTDSLLLAPQQLDGWSVFAFA